MLYAAKCYWPDVTEAELERVAARAAHAGALAPSDVTYLGSLLFADDDLVLCLFSGPSRVAVKRAGERAGVPWERLMAAVWHAPDRPLSK
jgi:Nickel responsive protein SCO4226-like